MHEMQLPDPYLGMFAKSKQALTCIYVLPSLQFHEPPCVEGIPRYPYILIRLSISDKAFCGLVSHVLG